MNTPDARAGSSSGGTGATPDAGPPDYRKTWCNPVPLPGPSVAAGRTRSLADPDVLASGGKFYLYATGGQAWVSDDLLSWRYQAVPTGGKPTTTAPALIELDGSFYLIDNNSVLFRASTPLGPWQQLGPMQTTGQLSVYYADWMFFRDDDGKVYAYHNSSAGIGTDGVFVTPVDLPNQKVLGPDVNCLKYDPTHVWEHRGDNNEDASSSWLEAGWMTKHAGRYTLQYSAPGTEYWTYAVGAYTADSPTGPFTYDDRSPLLKDNHRLMRGPGHHAVFTGPDGQLWTMYHVLVRNTGSFERRLALDRVSFDAQGRMLFEGPTETPQWSPASGRRGDAGLSDLSAGAGATATADSTLVGSSPANAFDHSFNAWWEPADASAGHHLDVDLGTEATVYSFRIIWWSPGPFRYRIEASTDAATWATAVDETSNGVARDSVYHVASSADGVRARHIRLTITGAPAGETVRVIEFTAFGLPR